MASGEQMPFLCWPDSSKPRRIQITLQEHGYDWSGAIDPTVPENAVTLKFRKRSKIIGRQTTSFYCRIQVQIDNANGYVFVLPDTPTIPTHTITNQTDYEVIACQKVR
jgi:hypothetical protein